MGTRRLFAGARGGGTSLSSMLQKRIRKQEMRKGGSLNYSSAEKYKMLLSMKMDQHRKKTQMSSYTTFMLNGAETTKQKMSKRTEMILKEMAAKKAAKEAKALRQRVVIKPRWYSNAGYINKQGIVYDKMNYVTMKVNVKNGRIKAVNGWSVGKYKPDSMWHESWMLSWIKKYSPYEIQMQKYLMQQQLQQMQQMHQQGAVTVHGAPVDAAQMAAYINQMQHTIDAFGNATHSLDAFGNHMDAGVHGSGPDLYANTTSIGRNNVDVTTWGVRSNNVWGTYGENSWGGYADNVWGGNFNNIWGGIGDPGGGLWGGGRPGRNLFNSSMGNGKNYLAIWGKGLFRALGFGRGGIHGRGSGTVHNRVSAAAHEIVSQRNRGPGSGQARVSRSATSSSRSGGLTRGAGGTRGSMHGPTGGASRGPSGRSAPGGRR